MMMESGPAAKKLGFSEREVADIAGGTRAHAKRVVVIYALLTAVGWSFVGWQPERASLGIARLLMQCL